jgi:hypothetical protein
MMWRAALIALAAAAAFAPIPPADVERYYSTLFFPRWQSAITAGANLVPFALIDVLLAVAAVWVVFAMVQTVKAARRDGKARATVVFLVRAAAVGAIAYLAFVISWGLNYRRLALTQKVPYRASAVSADAVRRLAMTSVTEVNALHEAAHQAAPSVVVDTSLPSAFAQAQRLVGVERAARPGRPKLSILDVYFRAAGVEGMTDPFFLETLVAGDLLPIERPFVVAHEWSHLAGFADEGEANFIGWLACTKGSELARYSAWLFLYGQVLVTLGEKDRQEVAARLGPGPREDLQAIADRMRRHRQPLIADAGWRVYDRYLKANRVEAGTASYAEVVRLVLGVRLDPA